MILFGSFGFYSDLEHEYYMFIYYSLLHVNIIVLYHNTKKNLMNT